MQQWAEILREPTNYIYCECYDWACLAGYYEAKMLCMGILNYYRQQTKVGAR